MKMVVGSNARHFPFTQFSSWSGALAYCTTNTHDFLNTQYECVL